jgi:hypothetical protein
VLADKWMSDTLIAVDGAPERVAAVMFSRTEMLFRLLIDRMRWINRGEGK